MISGMGTPHGAMMGGFNPMLDMGVGMGRFGMGWMSGAMNPMATAGNMGMGGGGSGVGGMRLGMGPISMTGSGAVWAAWSRRARRRAWA